MDILFVNGLKVSTTIGAFKWEQQIKQSVILDIEMAVDIKKAALSDNIAHTLDYVVLVERLTNYIEENKFVLIETLADRAAQVLLDEFAIKWLRLKLRKPGALPQAKEVGVVIERKVLEQSI